ncbi:EKC/KEOPS complex subunit TPRKB-like isoform X1 [Actinia tenebrosa]|uniref:EKC/KEOPS complex subunit TPRKB-like isoform X1 n=1 Tax=Actinia tenebrosa TaxID=6105 RepID=A0A6P8HVY1_ACTTE|nr:EKC/KEOPS complex subunit TPRKB-like isoform X1 [Actinia tenebrosa]
MAEQEEISVYQLENSTEHCVALSLFVDITNSPEIRKLVMEGRIEATFLKPSMIADPFQVVLAAHKALHLSKLQKTKTKTLHSEIIFNLSPTNNITDSFKKFGLSENDTTLLLAVITTGDGVEKMRAISQHVKGRQVPISNLKTLADQQAIKKVYKIQDCELKVSSLTESVICRMATKDVL